MTSLRSRLVAAVPDVFDGTDAADAVLAAVAAHLRDKAARMRAVLQTVTEPEMRIVVDAAAMATDSTALEIEYEVTR